jgi:hypothetical protein
MIPTLVPLVERKSGYVAKESKTGRKKMITDKEELQQKYDSWHGKSRVKA